MTWSSEAEVQLNGCQVVKQSVFNWTMQLFQVASMHRTGQMILYSKDHETRTLVLAHKRRVLLLSRQSRPVPVFEPTSWLRVYWTQEQPR